MNPTVFCTALLKIYEFLQKEYVEDDWKPILIHLLYSTKIGLNLGIIQRQIRNKFRRTNLKTLLI